MSTWFKNIASNGALIAVVILVWAVGRPADLTKDLWRFKMLFDHRGNIESFLNQEMQLGISSIKNHIAADDTLYRLTNGNASHFTTYRFHLYPVRLVDVEPEHALSKSPILINSSDIDSMVELVKQYPYQYEPDSDHIIHSKTPLVEMSMNPSSRTWSLLWFMCGHLFLWFIGFLVVMRIKMSSLLKVLISPLIGYVLVNTISFVGLLIVGHLTTWLWLFPLIIASVFVAYFHRAELTQEFNKILSELKEASRSLTSKDLTTNLMALLTLVSFLICLLHIVFRPVWAGDAVAFWILKADVLYNEGLNFVGCVQNEYPIFWSQFPAIFYDLNGGIDHLFAKGYLIVLLLLLHGFIWEFSRGLNARLRWFFMFIYFPLFGYHWSYSLFAETITVVFLFAFTRVTILFVTDNLSVKGFLALCLLFFWGFAQTKMEGAVHVVMLLLPFAIYHRRLISPSVIVSFAIMLGMIVVSLWYWKEIMVEHGWHISEHGAESPSGYKIGLIARSLLNTIGNLSSFSIGLLATMLFYLGVSTRSNVSNALILALLTALIFAGIALLGWDSERVEAYSWTAIPRLLWHSIPFIFFLAIQLIHDSRPKSEEITYSKTEAS